MGVTGLWPLLEPVGRRINIEALANKTLAVDASVWLFQFIKAMRDERGELIKNAHLLGFFRRICRLLFHKICPVFVFDGATPALKRRTTIARRRRREQQDAKLRKTAEKLLLNQLKQHALGKLPLEVGKGKAAKGRGTKRKQGQQQQEEGQEHEQEQQGQAQGSNDPGSVQQQLAAAAVAAVGRLPGGQAAAAGPAAAPPLLDEDQPGTSASHAAAAAAASAAAEGGVGGQPGDAVPPLVDELLAAQLAAGGDDEWEEVPPAEMVGVDAAAGEQGGGGEEEEDDGLAGDLEMLIPADGELDPEVLSTLPPSLQLEIIMRARDQRMMVNREKFEARTGLPSSFSQFQLEQAVPKVVGDKVEQVRSAVNAAAAGDEAARRIAAEEGREYVLRKETEEAGGTAAEQPLVGLEGACDLEAPLEFTFEVPAVAVGSADARGSSSELEWEDVEPDAEAPEPAAEAEGPIAQQQGKLHWRERAAQRQRYWSLSHGFQKGRALADWGKEEAGGGEAAAGQYPFELGEDDEEFQRAIQESLQATGATAATQPRTAASSEVVVIDEDESPAGQPGSTCAGLAQAAPEPMVGTDDGTTPAEAGGQLASPSRAGTHQQRRQQWQQLSTTLGASSASQRPQLPDSAPPSRLQAHPADFAFAEAMQPVCTAVDEDAVELSAAVAAALLPEQQEGKSQPPACASAPALSAAAAAGTNRTADAASLVPPAAAAAAGMDAASYSSLQAAEPQRSIGGAEVHWEGGEQAGPASQGWGDGMEWEDLEGPDQWEVVTGGSQHAEQLQQAEAGQQQPLQPRQREGVNTSLQLQQQPPQQLQQQPQQLQQPSLLVTAEQAGAADLSLPSDVERSGQPMDQLAAEVGALPAVLPPHSADAYFEPSAGLASLIANRKAEMSNLQREEQRLRTTRRAQRGQADAPTTEMYAECQELLQALGGIQPDLDKDVLFENLGGAEGDLEQPASDQDNATYEPSPTPAKKTRAVKKKSSKR